MQAWEIQRNMNTTGAYASMEWPLFKVLFENEVCGVKRQKCK